jgi:hypothetical protein
MNPEFMRVDRGFIAVNIGEPALYYTKHLFHSGNKLSAILILAILAVLPTLAVPMAFAAPPVPFATGDVIAGVGGGQLSQFSNTGVLKDTLDTTTGSSEDTGMCFLASGDLLTTNWPGNSYGMSQFDTNGNLVNKFWAPPATFSGHPESCVVDNSGDVYVGQTDGTHIYKFDSAGNLLNTYTPTIIDTRGIDWLDLAADQCTIYYAGEGSSIQTFNVCTNTQGPAFVTGLVAPCFALRIRSGGDVMIACAGDAYHISSTGTILMTYPRSGLVTPTGGSESSELFALNLDPDGTSFWTAGYTTGNIYRIDIATGAQITVFNAPHTLSVAGLAVVGELTQGCAPNCPGHGVPEFNASPLLVTAMGLLVVVLFRRFRLPTGKQF